MDQHSDRGIASSIEFLDDPSDSPKASGRETRRPWWRLAAVGRRSPLSFAIPGAMSAAAVITIVSVFLTQLTFRPFPPLVPGDDSTYVVDGLGRYHLVRGGAPGMSLGGHLLAFGAVAIAGAVTLLVSAMVAVLPRSGRVASAVSGGVACLAAGAVAASLACEAMWGDSFPNHAWAFGFWLFVAGASLAVVASVASVTIAFRESDH